jgi:hypothetical protein
MSLFSIVRRYSTPVGSSSRLATTGATQLASSPSSRPYQLIPIAHGRNHTLPLDSGADVHHSSLARAGPLYNPRKRRQGRRASVVVSACSGAAVLTLRQVKVVSRV